MLSNLYVVDILIGDGMTTRENAQFTELINDLLYLYDRHKDFHIIRATAYFDGESADVKMKVIETIKQRRKDAR